MYVNGENHERRPSDASCTPRPVLDANKRRLEGGRGVEVPASPFSSHTLSYRPKSNQPSCTPIRQLCMCLLVVDFTLVLTRIVKSVSSLQVERKLGIFSRKYIDHHDPSGRIHGTSAKSKPQQQPVTPVTIACVMNATQ